MRVSVSSSGVLPVTVSMAAAALRHGAPSTATAPAPATEEPPVTAVRTPRSVCVCVWDAFALNDEVTRCCPSDIGVWQEEEQVQAENEYCRVSSKEI